MDVFWRSIYKMLYYTHINDINITQNNMIFAEMTRKITFIDLDFFSLHHFLQISARKVCYIVTTD